MAITSHPQVFILFLSQLMFCDVKFQCSAELFQTNTIIIIIIIVKKNSNDIISTSFYKKILKYPKIIKNNLELKFFHLICNRYKLLSFEDSTKNIF